MTDRPDMSDAERAQAALEQLKSIRAFDLAYEMMIGLVSFGYQKMGLTGETEGVRDLDDARLSIELLRANLEVVEREHGPERTGDLRATLAQMQLGYARAVQLAGARSRSPADAPAEASAEDAPVGEAPPEPSHAADPDVAPEAEPAGGEPGAEQPAPKESAVRKPAAKKPAAKKPAANKAASDGAAAKQRASKTAPKGTAPKKKTDAAPDEG